MTVIPIAGEPDRFQVMSATDGLPWVVDLHPGQDMPRCSCAIIHNRTAARWHCQHLRAVIHFLRHEKETQIPT